MTDSCEGVNCGRSDCPCKQKQLNRSKESHSSLNSEGDLSGAEWIEVSRFSERVIGKDGNYFDCDVCQQVGTLLCCDSCPSAFHLECLEPPMESAPSGDWQCEKCSSEGDTATSAPKSQKKRLIFSRRKDLPSSSGLSLGEKQVNEKSDVLNDPKSESSAVNQKLPTASSLSLDKLVEAVDILEKASEADVHGESQGESANTLSGKEGAQSGFKMGELCVYERSMRKTKVWMEEGVNLGDLSGAASDKPAQNPVAIDGAPVEEQKEAVVFCQDLNEKPYSETSDDILQDKLLMPRDVSQASADGHVSQNNELSDSLLEERLRDEEAKAKRERLARLRASQKSKVAQRLKKVGVLASCSRPSGNEGPVQFHGLNFNGFSGLLNKSSGIVPIAATPLRMIRHEDSGNKGAKQSSGKTNNFKNFFQNLSVDSNQKQLNRGKGLGDQFPGFPSKEAPIAECLTAGVLKRQKAGISEFPSPWLSTLPSQPRDDYPRKIPTLDFFSGFPMTSAGYNHSRKMEVDEPWSNNELDSLWVGVRRYGQGNWQPMLKDCNLCFSRGKTVTDLAKMWEKEKAKYFGTQVATTNNPTKGKKKMMDIDLNLEPSPKGWMPSESSGKAKTDEPKVLLGIHIEIPVTQPVPDAGDIGASWMRVRQPISGPGGINANRIPRQEAVSGLGGNGANRMAEFVEVSSDSDADVNSSDSEATISN